MQDARRKRLAWKIADRPFDPPDPALHPDEYQLRCVALSESAVAAWDRLRNEHFNGPGRELEGAFIHEVLAYLILYVFVTRAILTRANCSQPSSPRILLTRWGAFQKEFGKNLTSRRKRCKRYPHSHSSFHLSCHDNHPQHS
jgi:hypothetical protein